VKTYGRLALRLLGLGAVMGGVLALGLLGWQWQTTVQMEEVSVTGVRHAPADTVRSLARLEPGVVMENIDAAMVEDRVTRHPWIERAEVTKQRSRRTVMIEVSERAPAALVVDGRGTPAFYLDQNGYAMPLPDSTGYDVPLVRGLDATYHPVRQIAPASLRGLLSSLPTSVADPLVAEVAVQPDSSIRLITAPIGDYGSIPVRLGDGDYSGKLRQLRAFAEQVLLPPTPSTDSTIAEIDLRFDGQIVTRTTPRDG